MLRFSLLLMLLLSEVAFPQDLQVVAKTRFKIIGLTNPGVIAGDLVSDTAAVKSIPVGLLEVRSDASEVRISAKDPTTKERVELVETSQGSRLWLWSDPPKIEVKIRVLDWEKRIFEEWEDVCLIDSTPTPDPTPTPAPNVVDAQLANGSEIAAKTFLQRMADDMDAIAGELKSGKVKTVSQAAAANIEKDKLVREQFKKDMAKLMQPRLGNADLKPEQSTIFNDIGAGFRQAVK